jgi:putative lipoprotein
MNQSHSQIQIKSQTQINSVQPRAPFQTKKSILKSMYSPLARVLYVLVLAFTSCSLAIAQDDRDRDAVGNDPFIESRSGMPPGQERYLPPSQQPPSTFKLGIYSRNTSTGVQVTNVVSGSVAQRSGIEAQDIIIAVNGYQVGIVNGRTYDIADELARRVDGQGRATLLVQNHRDSRLVNIPVQFFGGAPGFGTSVFGSANTGNRNLVQPGMILIARVIDVTYPQWQNVALGETQVPFVGRWPIDFQVDIDPSQVRPNHRYAIEAKIVQRGYTVLEMNSPASVNLNAGNPRVALTLVPPNGGTNPGIPPNGNRPIDQIGQWYQQLLGRPMNDRESTVWQRELAKGKSIDEIYATILSSSEYYDRFYGNVDRYISELYRVLFRRNPTAVEVQSLRNQLARPTELRLPVVLNLVRQSNR